MNSSDCSLTIELLPEFGWSIHGQPIYGPGSVFQGFVKLNMHTRLPVERVRLAFYATEAIPSLEFALNVSRFSKKTLFSIQNTLWDSKEVDHLDPDVDYSFPFTIQMPMIQFPPSIDHRKYQSVFQLIAIVDTPTLDTPTIKSVMPVTCMPFVETSLLKMPLKMHAQKGDLSGYVRMGAQEFVPGDHIPISLHVESSKKKRSSSVGGMEYVTVRLELVQTMSFIEGSNDIPDQTKTVASTTSNLLLVKGVSDADFEIKIPVDITPTFDYGKLVNVSYKLQVSVDQKGPLGGIWSLSVNWEDIHITIGTLGYGIRTSNELKLYTEFEAETPTTMITATPTPKFMKNIEYEDALPLYEDSKLPTYEHATIL
ncbi:hypothetical protein INT47_007678 [Mucor saturninus]|uniref:Arrestin C-terminal-like domain-containing protein n=1 Tax=Mucor saturninus TaxID=64648 RepID=A0A8H7UP73_9FUNG|nr:hypothetical protein INT47_007678 [Mucor saturninus]